MERGEQLTDLDASGGILNEEVLGACAALGDTALSDEAIAYIHERRFRSED